MTRPKSVVRTAVLSALTGCAVARPGDAPAETAAVLAPVNLVPDVVVNTVGYATLPLWAVFGIDIGNLWPMLWVFSPVLGPAAGIDDTGHGRPFWRANFFYEMRKMNPPATSPEPERAADEAKDAAAGR